MMTMYSIHDDDDDDDDDGDDDDDDDDAGWLPLYSIHGSNQVWDQLHPTCFSFPQSSSSSSLSNSANFHHHYQLELGSVLRT